MNSPESILVLRRKAIGDVLVSLAVVEALRERWPDAAIDFVVDEVAEEVVAEVATLREVLVYPARRLRRSGSVERLRITRQWVQRLRSRDYEVVLDLLGTPQTAAWTWWTRAPVRVGRERRGRGWAYTHRLPAHSGPRFAGEVFLDWVRILGTNCGAWRPVPPFAGLRWRGPSAGRPRILLNPSASWPAKAWPGEHFGRLSKILGAEVGAEVLVAWGPGEETLRDAVCAAAGGAAEALAPTGLRELAAEMARMDLVIGTDSGPKHLAVAVGTPTLTLFGSTDPRGWQPPGRIHRWLTHRISCHPCDRLDCPIEGHPCLDDLRPEEVAERAVTMLTAASVVRRDGVRP